MRFAGRMSSKTLIRPTIDGITERFDPTGCVDETVRHRAVALDHLESGHHLESGRYIEVQGPERTLVIPLTDEVLHIGRGLSAELRLDETSVSRRHAILVPRPSGARILDDRSSNGTFVNGRRIQQVDLSSGDVIVLGRVVMRYLEF